MPRCHGWQGAAMSGCTVCRGAMDGKERLCQDVRSFFAPCKNDISTIHGGRMPRAQGSAGAAWLSP